MVVGTVRSFEVTWGEENGWHPHLHELVFVRDGCRVGDVGRALRESWSSAVEGVWRRGNEHSVEVQVGDAAAARYVSKVGGWDGVREVVKGVSKSGRHGRLSPLGLLYGSMMGDCSLGSLWQEYYWVFRGRRMLVWSRGLREALGLGVDVSDEELAEADGDVASVVLASLTREQWRVILANDARAEVLEAAEGGYEALRAFLGQLGVVL